MLHIFVLTVGAHAPEVRAGILSRQLGELNAGKPTRSLLPATHDVDDVSPIGNARVDAGSHKGDTSLPRHR